MDIPGAGGTFLGIYEDVEAEPIELIEEDEDEEFDTPLLRWDAS